MKASALLLLSSVLSAGAIVPVNGFGTYSWSPFTAGYSLQISGTNGQDTVSLSVLESATLALGSDSVLASSSQTSGIGIVDGIEGVDLPGQAFPGLSFSLGGPGAFISVFNPANQEAAYVPIDSRVKFFHITETQFNGQLESVHADFEVSPAETPEVGTLAFMAFGLMVLAALPGQKKQS